MTQLRGTGLRRVVVAAAVLVVLVGAVVGVVVAGSGAVAPPATGAARLVPAGALAYVNVSLDQRREPVVRALRHARTLPGFSRLMAALEARLGSVAGVTGFARAAGPWVGGEAALALLRSSATRAGALVVLSVRDERAFSRFLASAHAAAGSPPSGGGTVARIGGYAVFGSAATVAAAEAVAHGREPSLAADPAYERAVSGQPDGRVLDAYASRTGLESLLAGRGGLLGAVGMLLDQPSLQGVSLALSPADGGVRLRIHSVLAPARKAPAPASGPLTLQSIVPSGTAVLIDVPDLSRAAPELLDAGAVAGIGGQIGPLLTRLGAALRSEGVDLHALVSLFAHESAIAVTSVSSHPGVLVLARTPDPAAARVRLAELEPSLASLFRPPASGPGAAPVFSDRTVDGVDVHSLQLAPGLQFNYAVFGRLIALGTTTQSIVSVASRSAALAGDGLYRAVLPSTGVRGSSLVFLDLKVLIGLGQQLGLLRGRAFRDLAPDLNRIDAAGLRSTSARNESTSELKLSIP